MGGVNQYRNSSSKRVKVNICGRFPSFYRNLCSYQVSYVVVLWLLSSMTRRKKEHGQNANFVIIKPKSGNLMKYLVHRLLLTYSVL